MTDPRQDPDDDGGPVTPRQTDVLAAIEAASDAANRAAALAGMAARSSHYNGQRLEALERQLVAIKTAATSAEHTSQSALAIAKASAGDVAELTGAALRIETHLGIVRDVANRASGTNEITVNLANLQVQTQKARIAEKHARALALWAITGKVASTGLSILVAAMVVYFLSQC